jgi:hypothetical protein
MKGTPLDKAERLAPEARARYTWARYRDHYYPLPRWLGWLIPRGRTL